MPPNQKPLFGLARPKIDLIVDVSNLAFRAAYRFADLSHQGAPTGHVYGTLSILLALKRHYSEKHDCRFVFALDGHCKWRKEILPEYKGNRGTRANTTTSMMQEVIEVIGWLPGLTVLAPDDEADDVIAAHIAAYPTKQHVVFSMDRDLWQLCHSHMVKVIKSSKEPPISIYQIDEDFFTTNPRLVPLSKALIGDTSDNVPGVKNFSREDLKLILAQMSGPDVDELLVVAKKLDAAEKLKPRTMRLLNENVGHIRSMLSITTLKRNCKYQEHQNQPDEVALKKRLTDLACNSLLEKLVVFYGTQPK